MRIAVDCRMLEKSGIGVYLDNILFKLIQNESIEFLLIGDRFELKKYENNSNCSFLFCTLPIFSLKELLFFPVKIINKCDAFYSPNYNIPLGIRIPIYCTIHDVVFLDISGLTSYCGKLIRKFFIKRAIFISKAIFTVSNFSKERIILHLPTTKNIIITYNTIKYELLTHQVAKESPYKFSYIVFVGNLKKHKGIKPLIMAFNKAKHKGFDKKLVIVGNYCDFKTVDNEIVKLISEQNDDIIFTGKIKDDRLYDIIAHASLLVQPSIYEGFGIPPLEALFLRCNVLISNIPVFCEIYEDLPVHFFNVGDEDEMCSKIMDLATKGSQLDINVRKMITDQYNSAKISSIILNTIKKEI